MLPVLRLFVACVNTVPGRTVLQCQYADTALVVQPEPPDRYPLQYPRQFWLYAVFSGCRGRYEFRIVQRFGVGADMRLVSRSQPFTMDVGNDPAGVTVMPLQVPDVEFETPGQYEFVIVCNDVELDPVFFSEAIP